MYKSIVYKYFFSEVTKSFLIVLFTFTAIAWTVRAVNFLDLVIENTLNFKTYFFYSLLYSTNIVTKFMPLALLLAIIISITKFQKKNELIILWSSGLNKMKIVHLFLFFSIIILIIQLTFASVITPFALEKSRDLITKSEIKRISSNFKKNNFIDRFKNTTFFVENINDRGEMQNIFIRDDSKLLKNLGSTSENSLNSTIVAKRGIIENENLILFNGTIHTKNKNGKIENITFSKTEISFASLDARVSNVPKIQETPTAFILTCNNNIIYPKFSCHQLKDRKEAAARRLGLPLYIPLISVICCFLLIATEKRNKKRFSKYKYYLFGFLILVFAETLVRYTGFSNINIFIYFIFPLLILPFLYFTLMYKLKNEKTIS